MSAAVMENPASAPSLTSPAQAALPLSTPSPTVPLTPVMPQAIAVLPTSTPEPAASSTTQSSSLTDPFESVQAPEAVKSMQMQRGMRPDAEINWEKLRTLYVVDEMGNKIKFTDIFKKQKTLIFFVRHFLDFIAKEYVEDLAMIPLEYLQNADVRLVVIGPTEHKFIKAFKEVTKLNYTLYTDPDREVYKAMGCVYKMASGDIYSSKHIKSGFISGVTSSVWRAMTASEKKLQGDPKQQGGTFIMGPDEQVHFAHIDQTSVDHCPINDVLEKAGVMNVSFPKDPRIQDV